MRTGLRAVNTITAVGAIFLISVSLWPGALVGCFALLLLPFIALLGIAWLFLVITALPRPWGRASALPRDQLMLAPIMVMFTLLLLIFYIPRRIAFVAFRSQFASYVPSAPASNGRPAPLDKWLGIYHADSYGSDPRGGVYFRTGTGADGIGPDQMSYGFAYQPNTKGTPFGAAHYGIWHLSGDWYWFRASDDWY
jgi:hypothetical protein